MSRPLPAMPPTRDILGIGVSAVTAAQATDAVREAIAEDRFLLVNFLNANNANIATRNPELRAVLARSMVLPDGLGVDLASSVLYGAPFPENLNGTDFVPSLFSSLQGPCRIGLVGARADVLARSSDAFARQAPQHRFTTYADGFQPDEALPAIMARIAQDRPDILVVAMGTPVQELWVQRHVTDAHCRVAICVGALFDFVGGVVPRAPLFMRRLRLEWLFRLMIEPQRLWRRYLVGNPLFLLRVLRQRLRNRSALTIGRGGTGNA